MQSAPSASASRRGKTGAPLRLERDALRLEALGLMTAGIVHELGNMIQVLGSAVSILDRHPGVRAAEGLQPVVSGALSSLDRANSLIRQILGFARGDAIDDEDLDATLCVAGMERLLRWITAGDIALHLNLAPEILAKACEPFFTTRLGAEGNGLGLAMVRRFVQAAGGCMTIHSKVGSGTNVTLRFPAAPAASAVL